MKTRRLSFDMLETRELCTLVFILNGNAFSDAKPNSLTSRTAAELNRQGFRTIQLGYPAMNSQGVFNQLAATIRRMSKGRPIGLVGFSAGGSLALRLAAMPGISAKAVLNYYGPPDLQDWLAQHKGDSQYQYVISHTRLTRGFIDRMSGPLKSSTYAIGVFGLSDSTVVANPSIVSFNRDVPGGKTYTYPGGHGVGVNANRASFLDFVAHL